LSAFAAMVARMVESVDLGGLKRLLVQAERDAASPPT
jgi:hypothetical protein